MHIPKLLYSRRESAELLSVSIRSIDHLISSEKLQTRKAGKRVLVVADSLLKYANVSDSKLGQLSPNSLGSVPGDEE